MVLVWSACIFMKTFTQRLLLKLLVVLGSFLKGFGNVWITCRWLYSIYYEVHFRSRKSCFFVFWKICSRVVGSFVFEKYIYYTVFVCLFVRFWFFCNLFFITVQTVDCVHLGKFCWTGACRAAVCMCHSESQLRKPSDTCFVL